jgi:hypothetical protein
MLDDLPPPDDGKLFPLESQTGLFNYALIDLPDDDSLPSLNSDDDKFFCDIDYLEDPEFDANYGDLIGL